MLNKIIILILSITFAFAKGGGGSGGGSFGGYQNANKYGTLKVSTSQTGLSENLYFKTFSHVRYKNWFSVRDWKSGYATSTLVDSKGRRVNAQRISVRQYFLVKHPVGEWYENGGVTKAAYNDNASYVKLDLDLCDDSGEVETEHIVNISGRVYKSFIRNNWNGKGFKF